MIDRGTWATLVVLAGVAASTVSRASDSDETDLPALDTIRASIEVRESATFPVGLRYDSALVEIDGDPSDAPSGEAWESVWFSNEAQVYRRTEQSSSGLQEIVNSWDGSDFIWANRAVGTDEWNGTHQAKWDSWIASSILWAQFFYGKRPLSAVLDPATAIVLGETNVDGVRCIAVSVKSSDAHPTIFELDPDLDYFPRRVSVVFPLNVDASVSQDAQRVRFPRIGEPQPGRPIPGGELYVITSWVFDDIQRIGDIAVIARQVETRNERAGRQRRHYRLRSAEVSESVERGDPGALLGGRGQLMGLSGDHWTFGPGTSAEEIDARVTLNATNFGREFGATEPGAHAAESRSDVWIWIGAAVGVAVGGLVFSRLARSQLAVEVER